MDSQAILNAVLLNANVVPSSHSFQTFPSMFLFLWRKNSSEHKSKEALVILMVISFLSLSKLLYENDFSLIYSGKCKIFLDTSFYDQRRNLVRFVHFEFSVVLSVGWIVFDSTFMPQLLLQELFRR